MSLTPFRWLLASALVCCCFVPLAAIRADEEKQDADKPAATETVDPYAVPEGTDVAKLVEFIDGLQSRRIRNRDEYVKMQEALRQAAEKILTSDKAEASDAVKKAKLILLQSDVSRLLTLPPADQVKTYDKLKAHVLATKQLTRTELSLAMNTARGLERANKELALEAYNTLGEIFSASSDEQMASYGAKMIGSARRLNLIGNEMQLEGETVEGKLFNLKSYRGKVVLVDFWATWCGPCIAELPNVKKNYELYHDKGFEVVGISLDKDRQKLEEFIAKRELPWICLFEDGAGWDHSLANHYGIMAIPAVILVDQDGKGITLNARGPALGNELTRLLGGPPEPKAAEETSEP